MLPESPAPGSPAEWLRRAKSNLALAKHSKPEDTLWEDMCFNTQQAVEKAIKAVFLYRCILFPFTHDIRDLLSILDKNGTSIPSDVKNASDLTIYAVDTRYPGEFEPVTEAEHRQAVAAAEKVVAWAEGIIAAES